MGEPARKFDYPTLRHVEADELLAKAAHLTGALKTAMDAFQIEHDKLVMKHKEHIAPVKHALEVLERQIKAYAKKHRVDLFEGRDRIDLAYGALLRKEESHVRKIRDMLQRLEDAGANDGIKIIKSVDWDAIEGWTDERLIEVGTERVKAESFAYEIFQEADEK
jgi:phage host-nuclease inhibitor protein Gam